MLSASVPIVWMVRNVRGGGDPLGPRAESSATLVSNVRRVANEFSQWVGTQIAPPALRAVILAGLLLALALLAVVAVRRRAPLPADWIRMVPLALLVVVYVGYLVASASIVAFGAINTRFLLPVFVPVVVLGAWLFERVRDRVPSASWRTALTVIGLAFVVVNVLWFAGRAIGYAQDGAGGYSTERWHDSPLMSDVDRLDFSVPTYSNDARAIELFLEKPARSASRRPTSTRTRRRAGCRNGSTASGVRGACSSCGSGRTACRTCTPRSSSSNTCGWCPSSSGPTARSTTSCRRSRRKTAEPDGQAVDAASAVDSRKLIENSRRRVPP